MRYLIVAALLVVLLPASAQARHIQASSTGLVLALSESQIQQPVEQESPNFFDNNCGGSINPICDPSLWVTNPLTSIHCAWDVDDWIDVTGTGTLAAGVPVSGSVCLISDQYDTFGGDNHAVLALVTAPVSTLSVSLSNDYGYQQTAVPVDNGHNWLYRICRRDDTPGPYPVIPDSNGGTGLAVNYTLTVAAPKRASSVLGVLQVGHGLYATC